MSQLTDVWELGTPDEQEAEDDLNQIVGAALTGDKWARNYLSRLWDNESWASIKRKLEVEGSGWSVWWMDGVRQHLANSTRPRA